MTEDDIERMYRDIMEGYSPPPEHLCKFRKVGSRRCWSGDGTEPLTAEELEKVPEVEVHECEVCRQRREVSVDGGGPRLVPTSSVSTEPMSSPRTKAYSMLAEGWREEIRRCAAILRGS